MILFLMMFFLFRNRGVILLLLPFVSLLSRVISRCFASCRLSSVARGCSCLGARTGVGLGFLAVLEALGGDLLVEAFGDLIDETLLGIGLF